MKLAATLAAAALTLGIAACGDSDDDDSSGDDAGKLRIGLEAPLSGDLQTLGEGMLNGAELAADQLNADGGLLGKDIEIVPIDDGGDAEIGVPAVQDAIEEGLDGVIGPTTPASGSKRFRSIKTRAWSRSGSPRTTTPRASGSRCSRWARRSLR
jgi:ABC-type branched-subunit amino acid transport system substrate-binding protein